jgi:serine/threonine-protein kinase
VALKLLYRRFAQDQQFVERFRREASAAAGLQHPNVVSVYDRGEFDGTYYIAMEFCEGVSLKDLISRQAPLRPARAIEITKRILVAARFAHRRGVIHRDLKPQNVIIDPDNPDDGVKVADFGIARAGASDITEVGAIMGTAQYLSPEQAQGHPVSEASDLYSVGIVLFEMLTGRAPFEGDSAVAIALKHVSQPPPSPRSLIPEIPPGLEAVVLKALAKDPRDRYTEADSFIRDLTAVEAELAGDRQSNTEHTAVFAPVSPTEAAAVAATVAVPAAAATQAPPTPGAPVTLEATPAVEVSPRRRGRRRWPWVFAALALAVPALVLAGFLLLRPNRVPVPPVLGQTLASARQELDGAGFEVDIKRRSDPAPVDTVIDQIPTAGERFDEGSTVTLLVSNGPTTVRVPDVLGLSESEARKRVNRAHLKPTVQGESSSKVAEGNVIRSDPGSGVAIDRGSRVILIVSTGPERVTVPDVVGQTQDDAFARLSRGGLSVVVRERASSEPKGSVVTQTPPAGEEVDSGSRVTLFVSNGKLEKVPDVVGLDAGEAKSDIEDVGFKTVVRTRSVTRPDRDGRVLSQTPTGGREQRKGGTVIITVGMSAPAPQQSPPPAGDGTAP